jgi:Arc/MetJ-type ribon-helix-helix transcriptional regulator
MQRSPERKPSRVSEPIQVYLSAPERARLKRLARQLGASRSDVIRQGIEALEAQLADATDHPVQRIIGLADGIEIAPSTFNVAREHDRFLTESEIDSWKRLAKPVKRRRR